jgi:hypothetical protein
MQPFVACITVGDAMVTNSLAAETPFTLLSPCFIRLPQTLNVPAIMRMAQ